MSIRLESYPLLDQPVQSISIPYPHAMRGCYYSNGEISIMFDVDVSKAKTNRELTIAVAKESEFLPGAVIEHIGFVIINRPLHVYVIDGVFDGHIYIPARIKES